MSKTNKVISLFLCLVLIMAIPQTSLGEEIDIYDLDINMYKNWLMLAKNGDTKSYDLTPERDYIKIKINVLDWDTGEKVPGVSIGINRIGNFPGHATNNIITATSDSNGVAYTVFDYAYQGIYPEYYDNGLTVFVNGHYLNDDYILYDPRPAYRGDNGIRFDIVPLTPGYSLDVSTSGRIRNCVSNSYCGPVHLTVGVNGPKYDDFIFHSGVWNHGAAIEFDLYVKSDKFTVTYEDKNIQGWDPADYPSQTVRAGEIVSAPSKTPVNSKNNDIEFLGWADKASGELFDFTKPVTSSIVLVPKWGPNPNAKGYIHLDSFLWNHDGYNGTYMTGQTDTTVNDLVYVVEYYDQAVAVTSNWHTLTSVTVNSNGQADFVLTPAMLQELSDFYDSIKNLPPVNGEQHRVAIDIGPSGSDKGWHEENQRPLNYAWDWVKYNTEWFHGAGLTGVRMMWVNAGTEYDLNRNNNGWTIGKAGDTSTPVVGNVMYASNVNHVPWLTQEMLDDGFEIYWKCYVAPAVTVNFDLNGGIGTGDYREQMMKPINSLSEQRSDFLVKHPGGTVTKSNMTFVDWYKVNADGTLETTPWDFPNRVVTESMVLRAVYTDHLYEVRFVTPENGMQTRKQIVDDTPAWVGEDPQKSSGDGYIYEFKGWKETTGTHEDTEYTFHDTYDLYHQSRVIYEIEADTPVTIDNTFANLTVYTAQFKATPIDYTLSYDLNGGSGTFADQSYTVETGVTIHNAEPTKTGYRFTGWKLKTTDGNWTDKSYSKNETVTGKYGNTSLIAQYAPLYNYKLNFNNNTSDSVSNMPENIPETGWIENSTKIMSWTKEPTRTDYTFLGWATSENGSVIIPAGTKSYQMTGTAATLTEQTLYAVWQINECPYKVKYLEKGTSNVLHTEKNDVARVGETVTEYAEDISGYELDSSNPCSIVMSEDETKNVIIFYYVPSEFTVSYTYVGEVPEEAPDAPEDRKEIANDIVEVADVHTVTGYTFSGWETDDVTVTEGIFIMPSGDVEFYGSWSANKDVSYTVRYIEQGTDLEIKDEKLVENQTFNIEVTEEAPTITGFTAVEPTSQTVKLDEYDKEITFYYTRNQHMLTYVVEGDDPSADKEYGYSFGDEIKDYEPAQQYFDFSGWYTDSDLTNEWTQPETMPDEDITVYGRFVRQEAKLVITKSGMKFGENAIFTVTGNGFSMTVVIPGNGGNVTIAGLNVGETYTITESADWSWRYKSTAAKSVQIVLDGENKAEFVNSPTDTQKWLDDESSAHNVLTAGGEQK